MEMAKATAASLCSYLAQGITKPAWAGLYLTEEEEEEEEEFPLYSQAREMSRGWSRRDACDRLTHIWTLHWSIIS